MRTWVACAALLLLNACSGDSEAAPEPTPSVQTVSDQTICDLLTLNSDPLEAAVNVMSEGEGADLSDAAEAEDIAAELDEIATRAEPDMADKVSSLAGYLRDYSAALHDEGEIDSQGAQAAALELVHTCGV